MIGIIGAMDEEITSIVELIQNKQETTIINRTFITGTINNKEVVLVKSLIGKVNASVTTTLLLSNFDIEYVINVGVAGGIGKAKYEDIVICNKTLYHDVDVLAFGYEKGKLPNDDLYFIPDNNLVSNVKNILLKLNYSFIEGNIATGDIFLTSIKGNEDFYKNHNICAIDMESASIANTCTMFKKKFLILRSISDVLDKEDQINDYNTFILQACNKITNFIKKYI